MRVFLFKKKEKESIMSFPPGLQPPVPLQTAELHLDLPVPAPVDLHLDPLLLGDPPSRLVPGPLPTLTAGLHPPCPPGPTVPPRACPGE